MGVGYSHAYTHFHMDNALVVWVRKENHIRVWSNTTNNSPVGIDVGETTFEEFLASKEGKELLGTNRPSVVKLNDEYNAEITDTEVKVGCQTFPHSKVFEIAEAIKNRKS